MKLEQVLSLARERARLELEDRQRTLALEVGRIKESMSMRGALHSSMTVVQVRELVRREYRIRAVLIWQVLARAIDTGQLLLSTTIAEKLKMELGRVLDQHSADLTGHVEKIERIVGRSGRFPPLSDYREEALERASSEIEFARLRHAAAAEGAGSTGSVVNVYQSYGIVQMGSHSTANLTVALDEDTRRTIAEALDAAEGAIKDTAGLAGTERSQALELVDDARSEIDRNEPNGLRIRGALEGIGQVLQSIAAAPNAYRLLKGAAALVGLQLP